MITIKNNTMFCRLVLFGLLFNVSAPTRSGNTLVHENTHLLFIMCTFTAFPAFFLRTGGSAGSPVALWLLLSERCRSCPSLAARFSALPREIQPGEVHVSLCKDVEREDVCPGGEMHLGNVLHQVPVVPLAPRDRLIRAAC